MVDRLCFNYETKADELKDYLVGKGFEIGSQLWRDEVKVRESKDLSRLKRAIETGTDRDETSEIWRPSHSEAIRKLGLTPGDVTYAMGVDNRLFFPPFTQFLGVNDGYFHMVYDPTKLEMVSFENKYLEMCLFKTKPGFTFSDALVAILTIED